jgi:hypothetical protein
MRRSEGLASPSILAGVVGACLIVFFSVWSFLVLDEDWNVLIIHLALLSAFSVTLGASTLYILDVSEAPAKKRKIAVVCVCLMALALMLFGSGLIPRYFGILFAGLFCMMFGMSLFAGFRASQTKDRRMGQCWPSLLLLWVIQPLACAVLSSVTWSQHSDAAEWVTMTFSLLFGPWATLVAKLGSWPNAGEFFHLPAALALSVAVAAPCIVTLFSRRRVLVASSLIIYNASMSVWFVVGLGQLVNCAE